MEDNANKNKRKPSWGGVIADKAFGLFLSFAFIYWLLDKESIKATLVAPFADPKDGNSYYAIFRALILLLLMGSSLFCGKKLLSMKETLKKVIQAFDMDDKGTPK